MSKKEFGINIHEEWKGMTQPVGLVLESIVLDRLGIFPEKSISVISDLQRRLESLLEEKIKEDEIFTAVPKFKDFCIEVLNWQESDLIKPDEFFSNQSENQIFVELEDYGEILKPDWIIPEINKQDNSKNVQILVKELKLGTPFDDIFNDPENKKNWEATHQQRFERLLKESENPVGIIWNGISLRLVYAPRGESSGHITFPLEPMILVDGRPMIGALEMLLGPDRLFEAGASNLRLQSLMEQSRKEQNEVGTRLSEQVLEALWILVRGFDDAEDKAKLLGKSILQDLPDKDPNHIYGGLLTILLRLVFLLYVEDEELMPNDSVYVQNYSVSGLAAKLRNQRIQYQSGMEGRYGAWSSLLSLFRLVFDGGGPFESYLPARHGELFDPDAYPFLEGRIKDSSYQQGVLESLPLLSDDVIERVLNKLLILDGQILSYRSLDVEQIGSVYEGIIGFTIEKTLGPSIGVLYKPPRQKIPLTFVINVDDFLAQKGNQREKWIKDLAGVDLKFSAKIKKELKEVKSIDELCSVLDNRLSPHTKRGLNSGKLILQPTKERRKSGSHYTPRSLTEPIVKETFRPWLEENKNEINAHKILNLKVCDPAMGSGAFLVASCRFLSELLVKAWNRDGFPSEFDESVDKDNYARRLVAQNCLYGVDKNPFAVNLAKLSLWLVTLSKDLPFTFVDHALKSGDSLIGCSLNEIKRARENIQLSLIDSDNQFISKVCLEREANFALDNRDDIAYDAKKKLLDEQFLATDEIRKTGDLMVAAFFNVFKSRDIYEKEKEYLSMIINSSHDRVLTESINSIIKKLNSGEKAIKPFHWELEFPEIFGKSREGFDIFIGNPPFAGKNTISSIYPNRIFDWLKKANPESHGNADVVAHFFRRSFQLLRKNGSLGLIATNTISQGDTRSTGLRWICLNGGDIFSARKRFKWPGIAAVIVSIVHLKKGGFLGKKILDGKHIERITAFLLSSGIHEDPKRLISNRNKSFQGCVVLGMGFTFDDSTESDNYTEGIPSPLAKMIELEQHDSINKEVIFPYIGGDEVNNTPTHKPHRYVIYFGDKSEKECRENWPEMMEILEKKVKPARLKQKRETRSKYWWRFGETAPALHRAIKNKKKVLVCTIVSTYLGFTFIDPNYIFAHSLVVFPFEEHYFLGILQSRIHEYWVKFFASSLGDGLRYTPSDCFETFPFPEGFLDDKEIATSQLEKRKKLDYLSNQFDIFRSAIMKEYNLGLTLLYNRFHSPEEEDPKILGLRDLQNDIDKAVLELYGWDDIDNRCGFGLEYFETEENIEYPSEILKIVENDEVFFWDKNDAISFDLLLKSISENKKKLTWRYRWPLKVRNEVISRLLQLNQDLSKLEIRSNNFEPKKVSKSKSDSIGQYQIGLEF